MTRYQYLDEKREMHRKQGLSCNVGTREQLFAEVARISDIMDNMSVEEAGLEV